MYTTKDILMMESSTCFRCKDTCISTHLVTALPTSLEDVGYVETAEYTILENPGYLVKYVNYVHSACLSLTVLSQCVGTHTKYIIYYANHRQPTSVVGDSCKAELLWIITAIITIVLVMIGAGTAIACLLIHAKKCGRKTKTSLKPHATLGEQ